MKTNIENNNLEAFLKQYENFSKEEVIKDMYRMGKDLAYKIYLAENFILKNSTLMTKDSVFGKLRLEENPSPIFHYVRYMNENIDVIELLSILEE